jgi:phytoene synthase
MSDITPDNLESFVPFATSTRRQRARAAQASVSASHQADLRECAAAIRKGSKSFHLASLILPAETRKAALSLYAFCRHSDDLIDDPRADRTALDQLKDRLDLVYRGTPAPYACDRAFARTVQGMEYRNAFRMPCWTGLRWTLVTGTTKPSRKSRITPPVLLQRSA